MAEGGALRGSERPAEPLPAGSAAHSVLAAMVAQPTGTLALVFTDIEGSTLLLDGLGRERYRDALAEHRRAVREAFARHHGYEVDNAGDGFFYAFSTAAEAACGVSDALEGLDGGPIQIRVGLHTGEPLVDPPKYVGLDVHRAARIMAAAHGGQALMSRTTRELLDEGFAVRDLGDHRLKDLSAAQRLFQLGPGEFPRPRTLRRTNLPVPATEFVGRTRELDDVIDNLRSGVRLLTLTGPGGTGKTRLSLQAAAAPADDFDDGVWWVPLASLRDPALVLRQTAHTLDVLEQPDRPLEEVLTEMLAGKRMLIVLDNAEHLLPAAAASIATLRDLDGPQLVVTSRERLQLAGEHVYPVPQLTTPEGLDLFTMRAAALDPRFEVTPAAQELCERLDNLPLAIELAAARTAVLQSEQILERLSGRLDLLKGGRDADPRQQTLRATIAWSYDLLAPDERELFARLAVFAGSASLEAVEDVCAADIETLGSLVDKSLVRRDGDRFWMLETIREFGVEQLHDGQRDGLLEAMVRSTSGLPRRPGRACRAPNPRGGSVGSKGSCRTCAQRWSARSRAAPATGACGSLRTSGVTGRRGAAPRRAAAGSSGRSTLGRSRTVSGPPGASGAGGSPSFRGRSPRPCRFSSTPPRLRRQPERWPPRPFRCRFSFG